MLGVWLGTLAVGYGAAYFGGDPLPLGAAVALISCVAIRPTVGSRLAIVLVFLGGLMSLTVWSWVTPHTGLAFGTSVKVLWLALGLAAAVAASAQPSKVTASNLVTIAMLATVPAAMAVTFGVRIATAPRPWISWAMANDSANNMVLTRMVLDAGGLNRSMSNPAPLPTVMDATWASFAPGTGLAARVQHIVVSSAEVGLLATAAIGVFAGLVALPHLPRRGPMRLLAFAFLGLLPWLWFISGFAAAYGFQNAAPAVCVLICSWICWRSQTDHPSASLAGSILAAWVSLIVWGPLVLPTAALAVALMVRCRRVYLGNPRLLIAPAAVGAGAASYFLLLTLPDLVSLGNGLAKSGAFPPLSPSWSAGLVVAILVACLMPRRRFRSELLWGYLAGVAGAAVGVAQLLHARGSARPLWGYYPLKFAWLIDAAILMIAVAEVAAIGRGTRWIKWPVVAAATVSASAAMYLIASPAPIVGAASWFTPAQLYQQTAMDTPTARMFDLMAIHPETLVATFWPTATPQSVDGTSDFWLIEANATSLDDPLRKWGYFMKVTEPDSVCQAAHDWNAAIASKGRAVRVVTASTTFAAEMARTCAGVRVDVVDPLAFGS